MGILRLLLAFSVFFAHAGFTSPSQLVPPDAAVHAFYVISGFYMAMVLDTRYGRGREGYAEFLASRALRLLPAYLAVALLTLVLGIALSAVSARGLPFIEAWRGARDAGMPVSAWPEFALSQLTLAGLDLYQFFSWSPGAGFAFEPDFHRDPAPLYRMLLVPQAWTLSVEFYFYLLAPWLTRLPPGRIVAVIAASLALRYGVWGLTGLRADPWSYRFFPFELAFFMTGALAYRVAQRGWVFALGVLAVPALALGFTDWFGRAHTDVPPHTLLRIAFIAVLVVGLPVLFERTKDIRLDRYLGELSYPLYISHLLVLWLALLLAPTLNATRLGQIALIVAVLGVAAAIYGFIDRRVDRYRHGRLRLRLDALKAAS
jgi:peptidoglycan/LPS O-acetylase OafA/YrhL